MAFEAQGEIHFICPSCGAPVSTKVNVAWVKVHQGDYNNKVTASFQDVSVEHVCRKIS